MSDGWKQQAACRGEDPEIFFPLPGDSATRERALAICGTCPVTAQCAELAERHGTSSGIYAGRDYSMFPVRSKPEPAEAVAG